MSNRRKGSKPNYIYKSAMSSDSDFMFTIGSAWKWKDGDGLVVRLHSLPINWDGSMIMATPKQAEADDPG